MRMRYVCCKCIYIRGTLNRTGAQCHTYSIKRMIYTRYTQIVDTVGVRYARPSFGVSYILCCEDACIILAIISVPDGSIPFVCTYTHMVHMRNANGHTYCTCRQRDTSTHGIRRKVLVVDVVRCGNGERRVPAVTATTCVRMCVLEEDIQTTGKLYLYTERALNGVCALRT